MKKIFCLVISCTILLVFSACGGTDSSSSDNGSTKDASANKSTESQSTKPDPSVYSLVDTVIFDDQNCAFTVNEIKADGFWGFTVSALCENNTDKTLMFSWDNVSVNGYMVDPFWAKEVAPGKKANSDISFSDSQLEKCNITSVDEIVFTLKVYDSDDWFADNFVNDEFVIYPTGLSEGAITYPDRNTKTGEQVIVDNESCTFIIESVDTDALWGYTLICYLVNKTPEPLMFSWDNVSVNGYMSDPFWAKEVAPGKRAFSDISFSSSDFETNGISNVEDIEFTLRVYNSDDWFGSDIYNDIHTFTP